MHEAFLKHVTPKPSPELAATTFVQRIFGGRLRSEVRVVAEGGGRGPIRSCSPTPPSRRM
jgi:hypothetical protein